MVQEKIAISRPIIAYDFALANLAATQTGTAVPVPGGVLATYLLPNAGYVVGYAANLSAAFSAGSADIDITINGTSIRTIAIDTASTTKYAARFPIPAEPFAASSTLGVTYTTDGSASPTTNDLVVTVFVVLEDFTF